MKAIISLLIFNSFFLASCQKETIEGQGLEFYLVDINDIKSYEFSVDDNTKLSSILILNSEIESYSWEDHIITLNEAGNNRLKGLGRLPFVVTINKKPIYGGWVWNLASSATYRWVFLVEDIGSTPEKQRFSIAFVKDLANLGKDPRDNAEIRTYLKKTKKLK